MGDPVGQWAEVDATDEAVQALPESAFGMTNFDQSIAPGLEADLRAGMRGRHAAWEFNGIVWYDDKARQFCEIVRRYHVIQAIIGRPSLQELMDAVNDEYGWE
jgi:hypothetical protein